jgi:hypothetical protein
MQPTTFRALSLSGIATALVAAFAACGSPAAGPCDKNPPDPSCSATCDPNGANTCAAGFHCRLDNKCYAFCTQGGGECGDGLQCSDDGRCIASNIDAAPQPDADCPAVNFTPKPVTPSIQLVLDRSGSMTAGFGNTDRWSALKDALVNPTSGVVKVLESKAYFGATIYPGNPTCSAFDQTAARTLNGSNAIKTLLDSKGPGNGTPTGPGMQQAIQSFMGAGAPPAGSPPVIVLATDGDPNGCNGEGLNEGQAASVAAATAAHAAGIDVYVLAMSLQGASITRLQEVANAGLGITNATVYQGDNPAQLKAAFDTIISGVVSCQLTITGNINVATASNGTVRLNGRTLMYGTEWRAIDMNTIELIGAACTELKSTTGNVTASFPCGVVIE